MLQQLLNQVGRSQNGMIQPQTPYNSYAQTSHQFPHDQQSEAWADNDYQALFGIPGASSGVYPVTQSLYNDGILLPAPMPDGVNLDPLEPLATMAPQLIKRLPSLNTQWAYPSTYVIGGQSADPDAQPDYVIEIRPFTASTPAMSPEGVASGAAPPIGTPRTGSTVQAGSAPILSLPIDVGGEVLSGQSVGTGVLNLLLPALTNPATINGLVSAGQVGMQGIAAIRETKNLKASNDPEAFQPYKPSGQYSESEGKESKGGKFKKFLSCQEEGLGMCCVMPEFCHPWAECLSDMDQLGQSGTIGLVTEIIATVPRCQCRAGFIGDGKREGTGCENANECTRGDSGCQHKCTDLSPGYACSCHEGFRLGPDQMQCDDIDECLEGLHSCDHICVNNPGGYACECDVGYILMADGVSCQEIDECALMKELSELEDPTSVPAELYELYPACEVIELCTNTMGGYQCSCPEGFALSADGLGCDDIDECEADLCPPNSQCVNRHGHYECLCDQGYRPVELLSDMVEDLPQDVTDVDGWIRVNHYARTLYATMNYCEDIDECASGQACPYVIGPFQPICRNLSGGFECLCQSPQDGFLAKGSMIQGKSWNLETAYRYDPVEQGCLQLDSCTEDACGPNATCDNTVVPASCTCNEGFKLIAEQGLYQCEDIDECRTMMPAYPSQRDINELLGNTNEVDYPGGCVFGCSNLPGTYECDCPDGFRRGDEMGECVDIDECAEGACGGACIDYPGGFQCLCPPGFTSRSGSTILGNEHHREKLIDQELKWVQEKGFEFPMTANGIVDLWKSAIQDVQCRPIDDLCASLLPDGTQMKDQICDPDQICMTSDTLDISRFDSIEDFLTPISCVCRTGYEPTVSASRYPESVRIILGIPRIDNPERTAFETHCVDIDECEVAYQSVMWGEMPPYECKKNKPCCLNTEGSYVCESKKRGECRRGIDIFNN